MSIITDAKKRLGLTKTKSTKIKKSAVDEATDYLKLKNPSIVARAGSLGNNIINNAVKEITGGLQGLGTIVAAPLVFGYKVATGKGSEAVNDAKSAVVAMGKGLVEYYADYVKGTPLVSHFIKYPINTILDFAGVGGAIKGISLSGKIGSQAARGLARVGTEEAARASVVAKAASKAKSAVQTLINGKTEEVAGAVVKSPGLKDIHSAISAAHRGHVPMGAAAAVGEGLFPQMAKSGFKKSVYSEAQQATRELMKDTKKVVNKMAKDKVPIEEALKKYPEFSPEKVEKIKDWYASGRETKLSPKPVESVMDIFQKKLSKRMKTKAYQAEKAVQGEQLVKSGEEIGKLKSMAVTPHALIVKGVKTFANPKVLKRVVSKIPVLGNVVSKALLTGVSKKLSSFAETMKQDYLSHQIRDEVEQWQQRANAITPALKTIPAEVAEKLMVKLQTGERNLGELGLNQVQHNAVQSMFGLFKDADRIFSKSKGEAAMVSRKGQGVYQKMLKDKWGALTNLPEAVTAEDKLKFTHIKPGQKYALLTESTRPEKKAASVSGNMNPDRVPAGLWEVQSVKPEAIKGEANAVVTLREIATGVPLVVDAKQLDRLLQRGPGGVFELLAKNKELAPLTNAKRLPSLKQKELNKAVTEVARGGSNQFGEVGSKLAPVGKAAKGLQKMMQKYAQESQSINTAIKDFRSSKAYKISGEIPAEIIKRQKNLKRMENSITNIRKNNPELDAMLKAQGGNVKITPEIVNSLSKKIDIGVEKIVSRKSKSRDKMMAEKPWLEEVMKQANEPVTIQTGKGQITGKIPTIPISPEDIKANPNKYSTGETLQAASERGAMGNASTDLAEAMQSRISAIKNIEGRKMAWTALGKAKGVMPATQKEIEYMKARRGLADDYIPVVSPDGFVRSIKKLNRPMQEAVTGFFKLTQGGVMPETEALMRASGLAGVERSLLESAVAAIRNEDVLLVPKKIYGKYKDLLEPTSKAESTALQLWDMATNAFRKAFLGLNPAWALTSNPAGNAVMATLAGAKPKHFIWAAASDVNMPLRGKIPKKFTNQLGISQEARGVDVPIGEAVKDKFTKIGPNDSAAEKWTKNLINKGIKGEAMTTGAISDWNFKFNGFVDNFNRIAAYYAQVEKLAKKNIARRRASGGLPAKVPKEFMDALANMDTVKLKNMSSSITESIELMNEMRKVMENPKTAQLAMDNVNEFVYNFNNLNTFERKYLRRFGAMFYSWTKHAAGMLYNLNFKYPRAGLLLTRVAQMGTAMAQDSWDRQGVPKEQLPDYLKSTLPVEKNRDKTTAYFGMGSMNPLVLIGGLLPSQHPIWQIFQERTMQAKTFPQGQRFTSPNVVEIRGRFWKWDKATQRAVPATAKDTLPSLPQHIMQQIPAYKWIETLTSPQKQYDTASLLAPAAISFAKGNPPKKSIMQDVIFKAFGVGINDVDTAQIIDNWSKQQKQATAELMKRAYREGYKRL